MFLVRPRFDVNRGPCTSAITIADLFVSAIHVLKKNKKSSDIRKEKMSAEIPTISVNCTIALRISSLAHLQAYPCLRSLHFLRGNNDTNVLVDHLSHSSRLPLGKDNGSTSADDRNSSLSAGVQQKLWADYSSVRTVSTWEI